MGRALGARSGGFASRSRARSARSTFGIGFRQMESKPDGVSWAKGFAGESGEGSARKSARRMARNAERGGAGRRMLGHNLDPPMKNNIGSFDAGIRFLVGCGVLYAGANGLGWWGLLGLVPIATAGWGCCPLYRLLRIDTKALEESWENHHGHRGMPTH